MDSIIKIGGRELPVHASLKTLIDYKSTFGTDLFEDLDKIQNIKSDSIGSLSGVINTSFQIIYILHKPYAKEKTFVEFMDTFEFGVFQSTEAMNELTGVFGLLFPGTKEQSKSPRESKMEASSD